MLRLPCALRSSFYCRPITSAFASRRTFGDGEEAGTLSYKFGQNHVPKMRNQRKENMVRKAEEFLYGQEDFDAKIKLFDENSRLLGTFQKYDARKLADERNLRLIQLVAPKTGREEESSTELPEFKLISGTELRELQAAQKQRKKEWKEAGLKSEKKLELNSRLLQNPNHLALKLASLQTWVGKRHRVRVVIEAKRQSDVQDINKLKNEVLADVGDKVHVRIIHESERKLMFQVYPKRTPSAGPSKPTDPEPE